MPYFLMIRKTTVIAIDQQVEGDLDRDSGILTLDGVCRFQDYKDPGTGR